jgi:hypothetical protein
VAATEYRWAEGRWRSTACIGRRPPSARKVNVIATQGGIPSILAAKRDLDDPIVLLSLAQTRSS